ncbi:hypothetical protein R3P38DRAFT_3379983 [Favolaschia claudopus]|uniref:Gingipain propeptide domain-containing protein n=1 Tax=Favolaschia claudopus TaxID=2862362 RepID=A0AAV9Z3S0_9AGAR
MKISLSAAILFSAMTMVLGAEILSPTPGQVLKANESFNLTYASHRFAKERSVKISVATSGPASIGDFPAGAGALDVAPTGFDNDTGAAVYSIMVEPIPLYQNQMVGDRQVYVIETFDSYGGNPAIEMMSVPVTFV